MATLCSVIIGFVHNRASELRGCGMRVHFKFLTGCATALSMAAATLSAAGPQQQIQLTKVQGVEPDGTTPLHRAAQRNDLGTAERLVRAGADVNAANRYGVTPLSLACVNGD